MARHFREVGREIWIGDGPAVSYFGFRYPTRTVVIRLAQRQLFVWSPIKLTAALKDEIDALGSVDFLVSPNRLHHLFLSEWKSAYPQARLYASPGLRKKRQDLRFDAELGSDPESRWASDIDQVAVCGSPLTEVVFFHRLSRTAVFCDLIQNFPPDWFKGWRGIVARLDGICAPSPGAPREWRMIFYHRKQARTALMRILAWPIEQVVMAHGDPVFAEGAAFVRQTFDWLLR
jgi:hypothetical protein